MPNIVSCMGTDIRAVVAHTSWPDATFAVLATVQHPLVVAHMFVVFRCQRMGNVVEVVQSRDNRCRRMQRSVRVRPNVVVEGVQWRTVEELVVVVVDIDIAVAQASCQMAVAPQLLMNQVRLLAIYDSGAVVVCTVWLAVVTMIVVVVVWVAANAVPTRKLDGPFDELGVLDPVPSSMWTDPPRFGVAVVPPIADRRLHCYCC